MTGRARRAAIAAFAWHTAELGLVGGFAIVAGHEYPIPIGALVLLAVIGWAWSFAHLPGRSL